MTRRLRIAVLWRPGRNIEWQMKYAGTKLPDDAREEAALHRDGLIEAGHDAFLLQWTPGDLAGAAARIRDSRVDLVFNASSLEEVALLELSGIPFCGSGLDLVAQDKATRKKLLMHHGVPTAPFVVFDCDRRAGGTVHGTSQLDSWEPVPPLSYPLFVKPVRGRGSSGISDESIVTTKEHLVKQVKRIVDSMDQGALVEAYIKGREVTVGILGYPERALTPLEIEYNTAKTNTYEHKMDNEVLHCPARLDEEGLVRVRSTALSAFAAVGARDFGRVDTIVTDDGTPWVLELNTFAGLQILTGKAAHLHQSYIGAMAKAMGMNRAALLGAIVEAAAGRYGLL
ncbi:MAG: ATP-grasp domain-containing protein [Bacillota bacterium]|nr:ATP-grasp domain-containing protein [Bacillota bacterium]